ncbi:MAG: class I SAM-dependent methyltransferase [Candidatus Moranbacteria bacterium]|nr:class I SAM-dependent methyltransferase [Candidatus Moranbacteria bacterium]
MKNLPTPKIYEQEYTYMPWGILISAVLDIIKARAPLGGGVIDLMCGTGYLLGEIKKSRSDLILEGIDKDNGFIHYAQKKHPTIPFRIANVLSWSPAGKYDLVLCTGALHHLPYADQIPFLEKIPACLTRDGFAILADTYIDDYSSGQERKQAAAKLGCEYLLATIENDAPKKITQAAVDILCNDVMGFEFKTSIEKMRPAFKRLFSKVEIKKTWPKSATAYGDYYCICRN